MTDSPYFHPVHGTIAKIRHLVEDCNPANSNATKHCFAGCIPQGTHLPAISVESRKVIYDTTGRKVIAEHTEIRIEANDYDKMRSIREGVFKMISQIRDACESSNSDSPSSCQYITRIYADVPVKSL